MKYKEFKKTNFKDFDDVENTISKRVGVLKDNFIVNGQKYTCSMVGKEWNLYENEEDPESYFYHYHDEKTITIV